MMPLLSRILITCLLLLSATAAIAGDERKLEVAVGESISAAKMTRNHTLTIADLEEGKTEYQITVAGEIHAVTLTKAQIGNILSGTTVNLDLAEKVKVRITLKTVRQKRSGW